MEIWNMTPKDENVGILYFFQIWDYTSEFDPGGIRSHNLLTFGQTPKPSCLGVQQEDSCLPQLLI